MNAKNQQKKLVTAALILSPLGALAHDWGDSFSDNSNPPIPFDSGSLFPARDNSFARIGYTLTTVSEVESGGTDFTVRGLVRFDNEGNKLWSHRINAGLDADFIQPEIVSLGLNHLMASVDEVTPLIGTTSFRFGRVEGATGSQVFAKRLTKDPNQAHRIEFFRDDLLGATIDRGNTIESLVVDEAGTEVYHKSYSCPLFINTSGNNVQSIVRSLSGDDNTYLNSVSQSLLQIAGQSVTFQTRVIPFSTNLSGEVLSASSFTVESRSLAIPFPSRIGNGSLLYRILASDPLVPSAAQVTHLVMIAPDGSITWSKTINPGSFLDVFPTADAIYLAGSKITNEGSNAVILKLDTADGSVEAQANFNSIGDVDAPNIISTDDAIIVTINSLDTGESNFQTTLVKMDTNLQIQKAVEYTPGHTFASLLPDDDIRTTNRFVLSSFLQAGNQITAVSIDDNLEPLQDCPLFEPVSLQISGTVAVTDLVVTTQDTAVTATEASGVVTDTTLPVTPFDTTDTPICEPGTVTRGVNLVRKSDGSGSTITFPTEAGVTYSILFSNDLQSFTEVAQVTGDGNVATVSTNETSLSGYYAVDPAPPEPAE